MSYVDDGYWETGYVAPSAGVLGDLSHRMDYLGLCRRVRRMAGAAGDGPTSVVSQVGEYRRIVDWVAQAWVEIQQLRPDWMFSWSPFSYTTNAGVRDVDLSRFGRIDPHTLRVDGEAINEAPFSRATAETSGKPRAFSFRPDGRIRFLPTPDASYLITGETYLPPQLLRINTDVPRLPSEHRMIIVYRALMHYGAYEAAQDVYQDAFLEYNRGLTALERAQTPALHLGGPLA